MRVPAEPQPPPAAGRGTPYVTRSRAPRRPLYPQRDLPAPAALRARAAPRQGTSRHVPRRRPMGVSRGGGTPRSHRGNRQAGGSGGARGRRARKVSGACPARPAPAQPHRGRREGGAGRGAVFTSPRCRHRSLQRRRYHGAAATPAPRAVRCGMPSPGHMPPRRPALFASP